MAAEAVRAAGAAQLNAYYDALGQFDTGIFGTEVLIRTLFERGYADTAYKLLTSEKEYSFGRHKMRGATTLWETWMGYGSHNHPMFGGCVVQLVHALLGICQDAHSAGFEALRIEPKLPKLLNWAEGSVCLNIGNVYVKWEKVQGTVQFEVVLPKDCTCEFHYNGHVRGLHGGSNIWTEPEGV